MANRTKGKYGMDLINAIMERKESKVKELLNCNANMDIMLKGDMAIHLAARYGLLRIIRYLRRAGDDINKRNQYGNSAIHYAAREGREDIVKYLIEKGADVNAQNNDGDTALHSCVGYQPMDVIERFVAMGMDVNMQNKNGDTPLHSAVKYSREESVEALLLCKSDPCKTNGAGKRPDQVAKLPTIGEQIRTYTLLATAMESGYIQAQGMRIAHTEVEKPKLIERVGLTLEEIDLPTDFPTAFYCRREKSENTTVTFSKEEDEEIVSDVFHVRVRDVYRDIDAKLSLPLYTSPTEKEQLYVKFVLGKGGKKIVSDVFEEGETKYCTIKVVLVPETTCACVVVMVPKAEETVIPDEGCVITSESDADFSLDIPEGAFESSTIVSLKVFDTNSGEAREEENDEDENPENEPEMTESADTEGVPKADHRSENMERLVELDQSEYKSRTTLKEETSTPNRNDNSENEIEQTENNTGKTNSDAVDLDDTSSTRNKRKRKKHTLLSDVYEINISGEQPSKSIKMQIPLHDNGCLQDASEVQIIRVDDAADEDAPIQTLQIDSTVDGNNIVFEASHFSMYVVAPRSFTNLFKMHETILNVKKKKQKARFFAMVRQLEEDSDQHVLLVECNRAKYSRERRRRWEEKGFEKQYPKHSKRMLLQPSDEFIIDLKGDGKYDDKNGETGSRRLVFSPHRASFQPYQIRLTPLYNDGVATLSIYAVNSTPNSKDDAVDILTQETAVAELSIQLHLPPPEDVFGPEIEEVFTYVIEGTEDVEPKETEKECEREEVVEPKETEKECEREEVATETIYIVPEGALSRPKSAKEARRFQKSSVQYPNALLD